MSIEENRKHKRIHSTNLLNYVCLNEAGEAFAQGMGRTLNVSESGMLLETHVPLDPNTRVSLTIGMEEEIIDIKGTAIYSQQNDPAGYETGIEFLDVQAAELTVLQKFIKAFSGS
ncbi:MAG: PilZ domain-containing protein [Deltaproteobacteria bacterium]|nr:PilZ domain-containing protein [Deltaproteobacteria bacterium]